MKIITQIIIIIILGFIVYSNSLKGEFIYDDLILIRDNQYIRAFHYLPEILSKDMGEGGSAKFYFYRPIQTLAHMLDYSFWKFNVKGYHLTSVLLHVLAALAIYWFINILYGKWLLSFFTSLLFVAHPINTEAVCYISGLSDPLSLVFMVACLIFYIKSLYSKNMALYILALLSFVFALLSKENAVILPLLILLYHYAFGKNLKIKKLILFFGILIAYILLRLTILGSLVRSPLTIAGLLERVPLFFAAVVDYLRLLLLPFDLHMEYGNKLFKITDIKVILGLIISSALIIFAFIKRKNNAMLFFAIAWFFITLLPVSNIYPIANSFMREHYLYVPALGFFLILSGLLCYPLKNKILAFFLRLCTIALLIFYSYLTVKQAEYWKEPTAFYTRTLKYVPDNELMYTNLGVIYFSAGKMRDSFAAFQKLAEINPNNAGAYNGLGIVYNVTGEREKAIAMFKKAITLDPRFIYIYYNFAKVFFATGKTEEAIALYKKIIEINPKAAEAYYSLGKIYKDSKEKALVMFQQAIEADPDYLQAYIELSKLYNSIGKTDEMASLYKKAVARHLEYFDAYYAIGNTYYELKKYREAISLYKKAAKIRLGSAATYLGLGNAYCSLGRNKVAIRFFKKAIELNQNFGLAYNNLAVVYYYSKQYALANKQCDRAVELGYKVEPKFLELLKPHRK